MKRDRVANRTRLAQLARGAAAGAALLAVLAAAGCGRKGGVTPLSFTPEGQFGQDNALTVELTKEPDVVVTDPAGVPVDTLTGSPLVALRIYDRTPADGYRLYRKLPDTGFAPAVDYVMTFGGTLDTGYELYDAIVRNWEPMRAELYLARGTVGGQSSGLSPVTNYATLPAGDVASLEARDFRLLCPIDTVKVDSLPMLVWEQVPGAVRYLVTLTRSADNRPFFIGFTPPDGVAHYQLGSGEGTVIHVKNLTTSLFRWQVEAIDADWRVIGRSDEQLLTVVRIFEARPRCTP
jgi:predicted small lipoprotein YifL